MTEEIKGEITVAEIIDNPDGSCTIRFDMSQRAMRIFAEVGLKKVLIDSASAILEETATGTEDEESAGC